ncbi:MAG: hypothetical protein GX259_05225 [Bacteroidales bacterium]|nr:hypothetical protein [Bacteroidales bacterium]
MRKVIFIILVFATNSLLAQNLTFNYSVTGSGNNVTLAISKESDRIEFGAGLGYNFNKKSYLKEKTYSLHKSFYATKPLYHINYDLFFYYKILKNPKTFEPFFFYDLQMKYSTARLHYFDIVGLDSSNSAVLNNDEMFYREVKNTFGPFLWIENNLGFGFKINFNEKLYLQKRFGGEIYYIINKNGNMPYSDKSFESKFSTFFSISLGYRF